MKIKNCLGIVIILAASAENLTEAKTIYGSVISADEVMPMGIYSFDTSGAQSLSPVKGGEEILSQGGGVYADGRYYSINADELILSVYDTDTWTLEKQFQNVSYTLDMTYDESDGKIYGCFGDNGSPVLGILNTETGGYTRIGSMSFGSKNIIPVALMSAPDGKLYCIDRQGGLYSVDKTNVEMTFIGSTSVVPSMAQSAVVDGDTGKCYWAAFRSDWSSGLYELDLTDGSAKLLYDFPKTEEITGLFILPEVDPMAPDKASNLEAIFESGSTSGSLTFDMPETSMSGTPLSGILNWTLTVDGVKISSGTATPGETVRETINLTQGSHKFTVIAANESGPGDKATLTCWIGKDIPLPVNALQLEKLSSAQVKLTWTAPAGGVHDGYVDLEQIRYCIVRYPDNVTVAASTTQTTFTESLNPESLVSYWYTVSAISGEQTSEALSSGHMTIGPAATIPYTDDFSSASQFLNYMITDANADGRSWTLEQASETATYPGNEAEISDDWLVTPPMALSDEYNYRLSFDVRSESFNGHCLETKLGELPNIKDLIVELIPAENLTAPYETVHMSANFHVEHSGDWYIGLHAISGPTYGNLKIDNLSVEAIGSAMAPAMPSNLKATAYEEGRLGAKISFVSPGKTINGQTLSRTYNVSLLRDGEELKVFSNVAAGTPLEYDDPKAAQGFNTYTAVASNDAGAGEEASVKVYVGPDIPGKVCNLQLKETAPGHVTVTWDAPTEGANGGYVDPDNLVYTLLRNAWKEVVTATAEKSAEDFVEESLNIQSYVSYSVKASSDMGDGDVSDSVYGMVGTPYETPFTESFARGFPTYHPWVSLPLYSLNSWNPWPDSDMPSYDGDGGVLALSCYATEESEAEFISPKIRIGNTVNPVLEFYVAHTDIRDNLDIAIIPDGGQSDIIKTLPMNADSKSWQNVRIPLTDYVRSEYVQLHLKLHNVSQGDQVFVDNITLVDDLDYNLAADDIETPARMTAGRPVTLTANVVNVGYKDSESYVVNLYSDNELLASAEGSALKPGEKNSVNLEFTPSANYAPSISLHFQVVSDMDMNQANNESDEITVPVDVVDNPTAQNLSGSFAGGDVMLTWESPDLSETFYQVTTDDFESYTSFTTTNIGDWIPVEGDPLNDSNMEFMNSDGQWISFPGDYAWENYAFTVVDLSKLPTAKASDGWNAMSGNKFLQTAYSSALFSAGSPEYMGDYLVSPKLQGCEQDIVFNTKSLNYDQYGLETIQVLVSYTGTDIASFKEVKTITDVPNEWTRYTVTLPEGAKYFAIHAVKTITALFLDDISYVADGAVKKPLELIGYNVYRNNTLINSEPVTGTTYTDKNVTPQESCEYAVSAIYAEGEASLCEPFIINTAGMDAITINQATDHDIYYNMQGQRVPKPGKGVFIRVHNGKAIKEIH